MMKVECTCSDFPWSNPACPLHYSTPKEDIHLIIKEFEDIRKAWSLRKKTKDLEQKIEKLEEENYRLRRQHELSLTHNPHQYGAHECCPCVEGLKQYPNKALGS